MAHIAPKAILRLVADGPRTDRELATALEGDMTGEEVRPVREALEYVDSIRRSPAGSTITDEGRGVIGNAP